MRRTFRAVQSLPCKQLRSRAPRRDVSMSRSPHTAELCISNRLRKVGKHKIVFSSGRSPEVMCMQRHCLPLKVCPDCLKFCALMLAVIILRMKSRSFACSYKFKFRQQQSKPPPNCSGGAHGRCLNVDHACDYVFSFARYELLQRALGSVNQICCCIKSTTLRVVPTLAAPPRLGWWFAARKGK